MLGGDVESDEPKGPHKCPAVHRDNGEQLHHKPPKLGVERFDRRCGELPGSFWKKEHQLRRHSPKKLPGMYWVRAYPAQDREACNCDATAGSKR